MDIRCFTVGLFQVNTYLITDPSTGAAAIVDTGESRELCERLAVLDPAPDIQAILVDGGQPFGAALSNGLEIPICP